MRSHRGFSALSLASAPTLRRLARVATLTSVRLEPIVRARKPLAMIEVRFADETGAAVVPLVFVDVAMLLDPERDVLVWPAAFSDAVDERVAEDLAATIVPWITAQTLGRSLNEERTWLRGDAAQAALFERARELGAIGAAAAKRSFLIAAPYVYAGRFWTSARLGVSGADAALGVALAQAAGIDVAVASAPGADADLLRWYGVSPVAGTDARSLLVGRAGVRPTFAGGIDETAVRIVVRADAEGAIALVAPAPMDGAFAFDPADGAVLGSLDIEGTLPLTYAARRRHAPSGTIGTSGGRIYFGVRSADDGGADSDLDEAFALADALRAEGFTVDVGDDPDRIAAGDYDLVHVHGLLDRARAVAFLTAAKAAGVATALHAHVEEATIGGWWGTVVTRYCYEYAADQRSIDDFTTLLRDRRITLGDVRPHTPYAPPDQETALLRAAIRAADVVFASGEAEAAHLSARYGRTQNVVIVPPAVPQAALGDPVGAFVGTTNYALVHAPIGARGNQIIAVRAAARARIPLVIAGTVEDASYLALLREFSDSTTRIITDPSPAVLETLYAGASAFVDIAWVGSGRARAARAAVGGARLVLADRRPEDPVLAGSDVTRVDPGDETAIMRALGEAWYASTEARLEPGLCERVHAATRPRTVAAAVAAGYALLTQASSGSPTRV